MRIAKLFLIVASLLTGVGAFAQQGAIKGRVTDESQSPLVGVMISIPNSSRGTVTDSDGKFEIRAARTDTLAFRSLGYVPQSLAVGNRTYFEVTLQQDAKAIDEVVVVGYGEQRKVNVTGAVTSVNYADAADSRPVTSTEQILQGLSAGLGVNASSGRPGSEQTSLTIRGAGTLNNSGPLIIIDGFEGANGIADLNPNDIESVSILKDAGASAIYGNRGANGVILITTKSGSTNVGKAEVVYSGMVAVNTPRNGLEVISNYADYMEIINESAENVGAATIPFSREMIDLWREKAKDPNGISESGYPNYVAYPNTDWSKANYRNGLFHKHDLSVYGAVSKTKYLISASYVDNQGVTMNSGSQKFQLRTNLFAPINKWLELGTRIWGFYMNNVITENWLLDNMSYAVPGIYPYYDGKYGWLENPEQGTDSRNNLYFFDRVDGKSDRHHINATMYANIKLPFDIKYNVSFNYYNTSYRSRIHTDVLDAFSFRLGEYTKFYNNVDELSVQHVHSGGNRWTFQNTLSWRKKIAGKHEVSALAGFESMYAKSYNDGIGKKKLQDDRLTELDNAIDMSYINGSQSDYSGIGVFGRVNYAYDDRYLFEANFRYDGSSRFSPETRWKFLPSFSAGWVISNEAFMKGVRVDNLKLRASWGQLGNNSIGNYEWQSVYTSGTLYPIGNSNMKSLVPTMSNPDLYWEHTTMANIGLELGLFKNRLTFETDVYKKDTEGMLYRLPIYATAGTKNPPLQNTSKMSNRGFEVSVGWKSRYRGFSYSVKGNFSRNWNEVSKFKGALENGWKNDENGNPVYYTNIGDVSEAVDPSRRLMEGKMMNEYYLADVYSGDGSYFHADGSVNPSGGPKDGMIRTPKDMEWLQSMVGSGYVFMPNQTVAKNRIWYGDFIYADKNGDGVYGDQYDYTFQGVSLTPKFFYGLRMEMGWKGIDFAMQWNGAGGGAMYWRKVGYNAYSTSTNITLPKEIAYDHYFYDPENPSDPRTNITSKHGRLTMNANSEQNGGNIYSSLFLYRTDYLKLKSLVIGYTFPNRWTSKVDISSLRIYFSGENLLTFTKYPGIEPEYLNNNDHYAMMRQYALGITVKF